MLIYKVHWLRAQRDFSFLRPSQTLVQAGFPAFYLKQIEDYVTNYFWGKVDIFGITREFAKMYMMREFLKLKHVRGLSSAAAYAGAKVNFIKFMSTRAAGLGWVAVGLLVAIGLVVVIFVVAEWTETKDGHFAFPEGACILEYRERLWWGAVVGRPDEHKWNITICRGLGDMCWFERREGGDVVGSTDYWDFVGLWEWSEPGAVGWYTYRAHMMKLLFLGRGEAWGPGVYQIRLPERVRHPWSMPVGWGIREYDACEYLVRLRLLYEFP